MQIILLGWESQSTTIHDANTWVVLHAPQKCLGFLLGLIVFFLVFFLLAMTYHGIQMFLGERTYIVSNAKFEFYVVCH